MHQQDHAPFGVPGTIYLIRFETPYRHARHYMGFTTNLEQRIERHKAGHGSRLMSVITKAGIRWAVVQTWSGNRHLERRIKRGGGLSRACPICSEKPLYRSIAAANPHVNVGPAVLTLGTRS
jgi:predicted GIY-YIG superfamily endonuclease